MAEIKDKVVTVESLKTVYDELKETKAPSGYGLGETTTKYFPTSEDELDTMLTEAVSTLPNESVGFFTFVDNAGSVFGGGTAHATVHRANELYTTVTFVKCHYTSVSRFVKTLYNGSWLPISWETPPMIMGEEYRTTEKWLGKAVYTRLIDVGTMPNADTKSIRIFDEGTDLTKIRMIDMSGIGISSESGAQQIFPIVTWSQGAAVFAQYHSGTGYISILARQDMSTYSGMFKLKYTKD